MTVTRSTI